MNLSLWNIEAELANLIDLRDQMAEAGEDVVPCETAIREYCQRELQKVDAIRSYLKHAEMMAAAARSEAEQQAARAKAWQARIDRLKEFCKVTMETWEAKRLDGSTGSILLKANGGRQPVTITNADLIPEELVQYEGRISGAAMEQMLQAMPTLLAYRNTDATIWMRGVDLERIPHKGRIAEALAAACPNCKGLTPIKCEECDGTGHSKVPGAHLGDRGQHVEIR